MVAYSMSGALKALIETLGLSLAAYRDGAPSGAALPHVVITESIGSAETLQGEVVVEQVQLDLYQHARTRTATGSVANVESYTLHEQLADALRGRALERHAPWHVLDVRVQQVRRWPPSDNVVRHTYTVLVKRARARKAA